MRLAQATAWIAGPAIAAGLLVACGGGADSPDKSSGAAATSCDTISQIHSYRYEVKLKLQSPAFQAPGTATPAPPLSAFADALTALFSDMQMQGAYVAPDRSQTIMTFQGEELELRSIGARSWVRIGSNWEQQGPSENQGLLTLDIVCKDIVADLVPLLNGVASTEETVSGVVTDHYKLDGADIKGLPNLLGTSPGAKLPQHFQVEIWLAKDGRWPARLNITSQDVDEQGKPVGLQLFMEFRDINDPGIRIDEPQNATAPSPGG